MPFSPFSSKTNFIRALPVRGTHHPSKNNKVRVCVKASWAEGPRRFHTYTACAQGFGFRVQVFRSWFGVQVFRVWVLGKGFMEKVLVLRFGVFGV